MNLNNTNFNDLLTICKRHFGNPRIKGSHHIFKMPWQGNPRINLQRDGKMAKPYQVKQVINALHKLEKLKNEKHNR
ncbi:MAG: toxin HicA [bacterium]|nr:toxin HicA [bacterium]MBU1918317.1 toxin HicA [bacterium]